MIIKGLCAVRVRHSWMEQMFTADIWTCDSRWSSGVHNSMNHSCGLWLADPCRCLSQCDQLTVHMSPNKKTAHTAELNQGAVRVRGQRVRGGSEWYKHQQLWYFTREHLLSHCSLHQLQTRSNNRSKPQSHCSLTVMSSQLRYSTPLSTVSPQDCYLRRLGFITRHICVISSANLFSVTVRSKFSVVITGV